MSEHVAERLDAQAVQALFDRSPFISFMQLQVVTLDHEKAELTVKMPLRPEFERRTDTKQFHGGPIASFIDTVGDLAIGMLVGGGVPTINLRVDYLRAATGDELTATGRVRRSGRSVAVVDVDVMDAAGTLVAVGRGTYSSQRG